MNSDSRPLEKQMHFIVCAEVGLRNLLKSMEQLRLCCDGGKFLLGKRLKKFARKMGFEEEAAVGKTNGYFYPLNEPFTTLTN